LLLFNYGCNNSNNKTQNSTDIDEKYSEDDGYEDGEYCADVTYYNPNTRTNNTYRLEVEVENNELITIYWSNGGWLDEDHFSAEELDKEGYCSFTSDKGYEYEVQITGKDCGYTDEVSFLNDVEKDEYVTTNSLLGWEFVESTNLQTADGDNVISGTIDGGFVFKSLSGSYYKANSLTLQVVVAVMPNAEIYTNGSEYKLIIEDFDEPVICQKIK